MLTPDPESLYYLAGPMTGYEDFNHPQFEKVATILRAAGFEIINPQEIDYSDVDGGVRGGAPYQIYTRRSLEALERCDCIILMRGWAQSTGAKIEVAYSFSHNMRLYYWSDELADLIDMNKEQP